MLTVFEGECGLVDLVFQFQSQKVWEVIVAIYQRRALQYVLRARSIVLSIYWLLTEECQYSSAQGTDDAQKRSHNMNL